MDTEDISGFEKDFGKPQAEWGIAEWKIVATLMSGRLYTAIDRLVAARDYQSSAINPAERKRPGRPSKPKPENALMAAVMGVPFRRKRGRPIRIKRDFKLRFINTIKAIKSNEGFKTDKEAVSHFLRECPVSYRSSEIEYARKSLSEWIKSVG